MGKHFLLCIILLSGYISKAQTPPGSDYFYRGVALFDNNNYLLAVHSFDSAIVLQPNYYDALNYRGIANYNMGLYDNAITDYQNIINADRNYYSAYVNLANTYLKINNYDKVNEVLRQATDVGLPSTDAYNILGNMYFQQGEYERAKEYFQALLIFNPNDEAGNFNLGNTYFRMQMYDSAAFFHNKAMLLKPNYPDYMFNLALDYSYSDYVELHRESENLASRILAIDPAYAKAYTQMARLRMESENYDPLQVMPYLNQTISLQPNNSWSALSDRGNLYMKMGMFDSAFTDYSSGIAMYPANVDAYMGRAAIYQNRAMYGDAIRDHLRALYLDSSATSSYLMIGDVLTRLGNYNAADSFYTQYQDHSENKAEANSRIMSSRSLGMLQARRYKEALQAANAALNSDPSNTNAMNNKGMALSRLGMNDSALFFINRSIEKDAKNPAAYYNRAYTYAKSKRYPLACIDLQKAYDLHYSLEPDPLIVSLASRCKIQLPAYTPAPNPDLAQLYREVNAERSRIDSFRNSPSFNNIYNNGNVLQNRPQYSLNYKMVVFPNPVDQKVSISINQLPRDPFSILMFDPSGRIVRSNLNLTQTDAGLGFDCYDLPSGRYIVMLLSRNTLLAKNLLWVSH